MPFPVSNLLTECSKALRDEVGFEFDPETELLPLLNLSVADIVWKDPLASVFNTPFTAAMQALQVLPGDAVALVDVRFDLGTTGRPQSAITNVQRDNLDAADPLWETQHCGDPGVPAVVTHFTNDERDPRRFYLWPAPSATNWQVQLVYSQVPDDVTISDDYPLPAMYLGASKLFILARALAIRDDVALKYKELLGYYQQEYDKLVLSTEVAIKKQVPRGKVN